MKKRLPSLISNREAALMRMALYCKWLFIFGGIALLFIASPPVGLIAFLLFCAINFARRNQHQSTSHGSASWANLKSLWSAGCLSGGEGIYAGRALLMAPVSKWFGLKAVLTFPWSKSRESVQIYRSSQGKSVEAELYIPDSSPHVAVYGSSGSAKTTSFAIPLLLRSADTTIVMDPKGELAKLTAKHRQETFGHRVVVLDPYGVTKGSGLPSDQMNPLMCFRDDPVRLIDDARRLAGAIVGGRGEGESDPYWNDSAEMLITAVIAFLLTIARKEASLTEIRDITCSPDMIDEMVRLMKESDACDGLLKRLAGEVEGLQGKTRASVVSVANSHLNFLDSIPAAQLLSGSTFDPTDIVDQPVTIYLCLPVDRLRELSSLQRVIMSTLINLVFAAGEDRDRRVRFLLDEAATLGESESVYAMIMFGRSYGLRAMLLYQSVTQLDRAFPQSQKADFLATVAGIHCGCDDLASAKEISEWAGKTTIVTASKQHGLNRGSSMSTGIQDPGGNQNWGSNDSTSYSETGRELITAAEVLQLPKDQALVLLPHVPPILARKTPYFQATSKRYVRRMTTSLVHAGIVVLTTLVLCGGGWIVATGAKPKLTLTIPTTLSELFSKTSIKLE